MTAQRMEKLGLDNHELKTRFRHAPCVAAWQLAKIIDQNQVDIIHMHWGKDLPLAVLAKILSRRKVRLVYTRQMVITRSKYDSYHRFLYRHVDLFLTITQQLYDLAQEYLPMPSEAIELLYYGVAKPPRLNAMLRAETRKTLGVHNDEEIAIGLIGRIEGLKGQHLLIEAVHQLKDHHPIHATIVGPVMDTLYFEGIQESVNHYRLQDTITFFGSHPNPIDIMSAFDVIILATRMETFGLVLIEAMRNGVAVIGSNAGGVPEIIEHMETGLLFEPENSTDLTQQLSLIVRDKTTRLRLATKGKEKADRQFSLEKHYNQLEKLLLSISTK